MKLQPCRPGFFEARDAIIQADQVLTGGENFCILWKGFAKRGMGVDAKVVGRTPWGGGARTNVGCRSYDVNNADFFSALGILYSCDVLKFDYRVLSHDVFNYVDL